MNYYQGFFIIYFDFSNLFFSSSLPPSTLIFHLFPFTFLTTFEFFINSSPPSFAFLIIHALFLFLIFFTLSQLVHLILFFLFQFFLFPFITTPVIFFLPTVFLLIKFHLIMVELWIFIKQEVLHFKSLLETHHKEIVRFLHLHKISISDLHLSYLQ